MSKVTSKHVCQQCGYSQIGWAGKCPECGSWGSLLEVFEEKQKKGRASRGVSGRVKTYKLNSLSPKKFKRVSTKLSEFDRVIGGGIVEGQVFLIAGEPGIGKSTILMQLTESLGNILYVSGEESVHQIGLRAKRLGVKRTTIDLMEETDIDAIISHLQGENPVNIKYLVIDSIQTMYTNDLTGMAGSVGQVKECAYRLMRLAKSKNITVFIVGHATKEGSVAGPAVLMHIVDTVLWFEGEKLNTLRLLRAVKNRFGPTDEVGIFLMTGKGLKGSSPERLFLTTAKKSVGSCVSSVMQGTRPVLVEIQSLVVPTKSPYPRRIANGIDPKRLEMIIAILTRRVGVSLYDYDCYLNVSGGLTIKETSSDLAICLSIVSSYFNKPISEATFAIGEVSLLGDIRSVSDQQKRVAEAKRLGYTNILPPKGVKSLRLLVKRIFAK